MKTAENSTSSASNSLTDHMQALLLHPSSFSCKNWLIEIYLRVVLWDLWTQPWTLSCTSCITWLRDWPGKKWLLRVIAIFTPLAKFHWHIYISHSSEHLEASFRMDFFSITTLHRYFYYYTFINRKTQILFLGMLMYKRYWFIKLFFFFNYEPEQLLRYMEIKQI